MKRTILAAAMALAGAAHGATLGQIVQVQDNTYRSCLNFTVAPVIQADINIATAGQLVLAEWNATSSAYALKYELWACTGSGCTNYAKIAQWPDPTVPATNNQDWLYCFVTSLGCYLTTTHTGVYKTGGLSAGIHRFQLRYTQWNTGQGCTFFSNRALTLQVINP